MRVAFLGLGIMGRPMAANLVKAGHDVAVWNRTPGKEPARARPASSPADAARDAEVVWMCVADTAAVEQLLFGEDGVENAVASGAVIVDSSTISPSATLHFAERLRSRGADYIDAPITGSKIGAESGQLIFMAGGSEDTLARLQPLFGAMGKAVFRMGDLGKGQSAKLALNLMIALAYEGFAEGLTLATKLGVQADKLLELINATMVRSGVVDYKAPFVLRRDFSPNFPLRLMHKDIHLMLDAAKAAGVRLPGLEKVEEVYAESVKAGWKDLDFAATVGVIEKMSGLS